MAKTKYPLDVWDDMPKDMRRYISEYGWNFSKRAYEYAASLMRKYNSATGKLEKVEPFTKDQVDEMLTKNGVKIENNVMYNYVYIATMAKADFYKSSLQDEKSLCLFIKDYIDDVDASTETAFRRWEATMRGNGTPIDWSDLV